MKKNRLKPTSEKPAQRGLRKLIYCLGALLSATALILWSRMSTAREDISASTLTEPDITGESASTSAPVTEYIKKSELVSESSKGTDTTVTSDSTVPPNPYGDLSVPTWLTKIEDTYFLVDCYHNQVIYNDNLSEPLSEWKVMTDDIDKGHTLASDGSVYLVDDTERHRILIFEKENEVFVHTQTFNGIGNRPHYIIYDAPTDTFYA